MNGNLGDITTRLAEWYQTYGHIQRGDYTDEEEAAQAIMAASALAQDVHAFAKQIEDQAYHATCILEGIE